MIVSEADLDSGSLTSVNYALKMGKEVFNMPQNYEIVIEAIEYMYQSIGVPTKLSAYKTDDKVIENITKALESHGMTALGEKGNITLDKVSKILEMSLKPFNL